MTSPAPVQVQFAVQFASFVVAAGGFALVLLRAQYLGRRLRDEVCLAIGFTALGVVAFLHGALLVSAEFTPGVVVQAVGLALVFVGGVADGGLRPSATVLSVRRPGRARRAGKPGGATSTTSRGLLFAGVVAQAASLATQAISPLVSAVLLAAAALAIGAALVVSSRRSIAGRVAASAGFTLLALVLVLSVALSAVLTATVKNQAIRSLDSQAAGEVSQIRQLSEATLPAQARLLSGTVEGNLEDPAQCSAPSPSCIVKFFPTVSTYFSGVNLIWVGPGVTPLSTPSVVASSPGTGTAIGVSTASDLAGSTVVAEAISSRKPASSVLSLNGTALAVAVWPDLVAYGSASAPKHLVGVAVTVMPLNQAYLAAQANPLGGSVSFGLTSAAGLIDHSGQLPSQAGLRSLASSVLVEGGAHGAHGEVGDQFVSILPVPGPSATRVALVAATSSSTVEVSQRPLFRTLFLIALGGTLLALLLASAIGDRIGAGLRRLTVAADAIRGGGRGVRAGVDTGDEVGELGVAFDSMATSIDDKTSALRRAADGEAALRSRLEAVVAGMGEALLAVSEVGLITDFNQAAEELIGVSATAVVGEPVDEVVVLSDEDGRDISAQLRTPPGVRWSVEGLLLRRGVAGPGGRQLGSAIPVSVSAGDVKGKGTKGAGAVFVIRDLRIEREIEQMKSEFLSRVGHELRTPLTGIMGFSELLSRADVSAERAREWHQEILGQSKRLLRTVEMLEFFASSGAGRVSLRREVLDPRKLVDEVAQSWLARTNGSQRVLKRVARRLPPLGGDRRWMSLALDELVDNAVKFSPEGGQVILSVDPGGQGRFVEFSVIDQGKGMSNAEASQAFNDFVQGDGSDTRSYGGLGLGLSLVQRVAEAHGGRVLCESTPGVGSRFSIVLPASLEGQS
ncbi:MAG: ATP-binding protein [Acidimicrobiales bacterium]